MHTDPNHQTPKLLEKVDLTPYSGKNIRYFVFSCLKSLQIVIFQQKSKVRMQKSLKISSTLLNFFRVIFSTIMYWEGPMSFMLSMFRFTDFYQIYSDFYYIYTQVSLIFSSKTKNSMKICSFKEFRQDYMKNFVFCEFALEFHCELKCFKNSGKIFP